MIDYPWKTIITNFKETLYLKEIKTGYYFLKFFSNSLMVATLTRL